LASTGEATSFGAQGLETARARVVGKAPSGVRPRKKGARTQAGAGVAATIAPRQVVKTCRRLAPPRDIGLAKARGVVPKLWPALRLRPVIQSDNVSAPWLAHLLLRR